MTDLTGLRPLELLPRMAHPSWEDSVCTCFPPAQARCTNPAGRFPAFPIQFAIMTAPFCSQRHLDWVIEQSHLF